MWICTWNSKLSATNYEIRIEKALLDLSNCSRLLKVGGTVVSNIRASLTGALLSILINSLPTSRTFSMVYLGLSGGRVTRQIGLILVCSERKAIGSLYLT